MRRADLTAIVERVPALQATADGIESLRAAADALPIDTFREPVTLVVDERPERGRHKKRLLAVGAADVRAWCRHMAYSVRVRLRSIESGVVHDISQGRLLPAAILLRSHLEAAAVGVYCLDTVSDAARAGSMEELTEVMHKTLFGTAVERHVGRKEWVAELVSGAETNTIRICRAVDALDRYVYQESASGEIGVVYSVLCEFAHPNPRGVKAFATSESWFPDDLAPGWGFPEWRGTTAASIALRKARRGMGWLRVSLFGSRIGAKSVPNWDENGRTRCYCESGQSSSCCTFSASA